MLTRGELLGSYRVQGILGQGGMASVYRVRHERLLSLHALKVLHIPSSDVAERLLMEGRVQAGLRHPNVVRVTDIVDVDGLPGLVMELVRGVSLEEWLLRNEPTLEQALALFRGIVAGVRAAHTAGVVHRDLKPANVLLAVTEEGVIPKVADFGLVKSVHGGRRTTRTGAMMGTPYYMAPEQIRDAAGVDQRADMFALGCMLYELCTGQRPFDGANQFEIFRAVATGTYRPPTEWVPGLPSRVVQAIESLLRVEPEERLSSCRELIHLLYGGTVGPGAVDLVLELPDDGALRLISGNEEAVDEPVASETIPPPAQTLLPPEPLPEPVAAVMGPAPAARRSIIVPVAAAVAGVAVILAGGAGAAAIVLRAAPAAVDVPLAEATPPAAPEPEPAPAAALPAAPVPRRPPERRPPSPAPEPHVDVVAEALDAEPEPALPLFGSVRVVGGDATEVWLVRDGARRELGADVGPGRYEIVARFGGDPSPAGTLDVQAGDTVELTCSSFAWLCRP